MTTPSSGFRGYRAAMQFHGLERQLFEMYMISAMRNRMENRARAFGPVKQKKFKPMVYGKS
jgi:hypothetical protein